MYGLGNVHTRFTWHLPSFIGGFKGREFTCNLLLTQLTICLDLIKRFQSHRCFMELSRNDDSATSSLSIIDWSHMRLSKFVCLRVTELLC